MRPGSSFLLVPLALGMGFLSQPVSAAAKEEVAVVHTELGDIAFRFFETDAPGHAAYVKDLIRRGFYDGTTFHRVIPHFVIQGGDPNSKDADRSNDGDGAADRTLKAEFSPRLHYRPGSVGMAREAGLDSGSCQFFIALENLPRLDGKYTIFGEVTSGLEVAKAIAALPRDLKDNPLKPVSMKVELKTKKVQAPPISLKEGPSGEVLTGPGKPKAWDPKDARWKAPVAIQTGELTLGKSPVLPGAAIPPQGRLDLSLGEDGSVLDVRFSDLGFPDAAQKQKVVKSSWRFSPAFLDGKPVKSRLSVDANGGSLAPSQVPGTPIDARSAELTLPQVLVALEVPEAYMMPEKTPDLRLTIDETGHVAEVSIQTSCGDVALDEAAAKAAGKLVFAPALRGKEPVAVYLNVAVRWLEPARP
jgi:peptidyl-prolyl cis-trans isomerase B (cyclophilin B)